MIEEDLYPDIEKWFNTYLNEKYRGYKVVTTYKTSRYSLDSILSKMGFYIEDAVDLSIKIDITGLLKKGKRLEISFIEVKNRPLTLKDLGQLWGYSQLLDPIESYLISSKGLGSLNKILKVMKREDLLYYGNNNRMMKIARWNTNRNSIEYDTLIPKL